jgi:hypothetical protein
MWHCGVVTKVIMGLHSTVVKGDNAQIFTSPSSHFKNQVDALGIIVNLTSSWGAQENSTRRVKPFVKMSSASENVQVV